MIEIYLSTDGKHTVRIEAEPDKVNDAYKQASKIYNQILKDHGEGTRVGAAKKINGKVPNCPVHKVPMDLIPAGISKKTGKRYESFYACSVDDCNETRNIK